MLEDKNLNFRLANINDVIQLSELVNKAYRGDSSKLGWTTEADILDGQRVDPKGLQEMIATNNNAILLCLRNNLLVGCVLLQNKSHKAAYLGMLTVRSDLQAAGLGKQILAHAEAWIIKNWQSEHIEMTVIQKRSELIAWYEKRGFVLTGETQPFPYGDERFGIPKVDDLEFIVMRKILK
jgi:ribosomal protein S18 acetylase RimI-like enzyme